MKKNYFENFIEIIVEEILFFIHCEMRTNFFLYSFFGLDISQILFSKVYFLSFK